MTTRHSPTWCSFTDTAMTGSIATRSVYDEDLYAEELLDIERVTNSSGVAMGEVIPSPTITVAVSRSPIGTEAA
jgi:hypothetical protein